MFARQSLPSIFTQGPWTTIDTEDEFAAPLRRELEFAAHLTWECSVSLKSSKRLSLEVVAPADVYLPALDRKPLRGATTDLVAYCPNSHAEVASLFSEPWVGRIVAYPLGLDGGLAVSIYTEDAEWEVLVDRAKLMEDVVAQIRAMILLCASKAEIALEPFPVSALDYVGRRFANTGFDRIIPAGQ
jgi:hypothetical protein